jgi:hypothetical protein
MTRSRPEAANETGFKRGDRALVSGTLAWKGEISLQGKIGEVVECRNDGRVTVYGRLLMACDPGSSKRLDEFGLKKGKLGIGAGKLKMWNAERGFGFIADDAGGPDMFFAHQ